MWKIFVGYLMITAALATIEFDLSQTNQYGNSSILQTICNEETQIDLFFSSNSKLNCSATQCTNTSPGSSTMKFLDINGNDLQLTLAQAYFLDKALVSVTNWPSVTPDYYFTFVFSTQGNSNKVIVLVPVVSSNTANVPNIYDITKINDFSESQLSSATINLDAFNYLNMVDYSRFYHVTDSQKTTTLLLSNTVLLIPSLTITPMTSITSDPLSFTPDYAKSGSKLCYASNETSGIFQEHLRESWPFWTCILTVFLFWVYYLWSQAETHEVYDNKFQDNKWTCWGFYSLRYLAHTEFISVLTRESLMFFNFSFQGLILSIIYSRIGETVQPYTHYQIIIWSAGIALAASLPMPYILGGMFLRKISRGNLQKFKLIRKSRGLLNKKSQQAIYEEQIDKVEESLYSYYFFYYVLIFVGLVCFWVPDIYLMMQTHRQWYYLHRLWLASLAITFVLDHLIFDPLFSLVFGNTGFYRCRGYYYNFQLGQEYKEIEE